MRVSGRNPPAVPLRTIRSEGSAVQWPRLCWRPSAQNKGAFAARSRRSYCLVYDTGPTKSDNFTAATVAWSRGLKPWHLSRGASSEPRWMWLSQRVSVAPRCDLWWMRWKSGTLRARKSITFLHQPPHKLHSWSIIFAPYLINPSLRLSQCSLFFFPESNLVIYSEAFRRFSRNSWLVRLVKSFAVDSMCSCVAFLLDFQRRLTFLQWNISNLEAWPWTAEWRFGNILWSITWRRYQQRSTLDLVWVTRVKSWRRMAHKSYSCRNFT